MRVLKWHHFSLCAPCFIVHSLRDNLEIDFLKRHSERFHAYELLRFTTYFYVATHSLLTSTKRIHHRYIIGYQLPLPFTVLQTNIHEVVFEFELCNGKTIYEIYIPNKGYDDILCDLGMCTLHERRNVICEQYFKNMQGNSHKLHHLLPEERCIHYDMRRENKYPLTKNRTNRYGKSLIPWD